MGCYMIHIKQMKVLNIFYKLNFKIFVCVQVIARGLVICKNSFKAVRNLKVPPQVDVFMKKLIDNASGKEN